MHNRRLFLSGVPRLEKGGQGAIRTQHKAETACEHDPHPELKIPTSLFQGEVKIGEALNSAAKMLTASESPRLDARILLKHALQTDDAGLIAQGRDVLEEDVLARYAGLLERRAEGEPVAYIIGVKEFWSLPFTVTSDVLIPRDDSGALIEAALKRRDRTERLKIADLGTGSGCLLCAILSEFPDSEGVGVDHSARALSVARRNGEALGFGRRASFIEGDWLSPLSGVYDMIIANPPYIQDGARGGLARDVVEFEPESALFAGADGLDAYRTIIAQLPSRLSNDGLVIMECGADQSESLAELLAEIAEGAAVFTFNDLAGRPRGAGLDRRDRPK